MKTRQGDSLFLKVDVGCETMRVFGRPEELAERLEASGRKHLSPGCVNRSNRYRGVLDYGPHLVSKIARQVVLNQLRRIITTLRGRSSMHVSEILWLMRGEIFQMENERGDLTRRWGICDESVCRHRYSY